MDKMNLQHYVGIYHDAIIGTTCKKLILDSKDFVWDNFGWGTVEHFNYKKSDTSYTKQCDTCEKLPSKYKLLLNPIVEKYIEIYKTTYIGQLNIAGYSPIKLNRYSTNLSLEKHFDHIHSLFDGQRKGIPMLSIVGLLNDDFEGGEFILWDDYSVPMKEGTIIIFPSNFLFPHRISKITQGTRHSFVSWVW